MDHRLIGAVEKALGWFGPGEMGKAFARGCMPDPELCARLLTPTKLLDLMMRRSLAPPQLRCFQRGTDLHPNAYLTATTNRRGQTIQMANMNRLARLMQMGCTLVLDTVDTFDPTMEVVCRALQWWSREFVHVNTYLTTQSTTGFDLHWDDHDVVIVQLAGEKDWEVRGRSRPVPMYRDAAFNPTPSEEVIWSGTLVTGDVMHIPRGYWHQATRNGHSEGFSLHVTFGFCRRTGVDWLTWVADRSREDELFRHDLDLWGSPDEWSTQEEELATAASRLVASRSPSDFLTARECEQPPHRQVSTFGIFGAPTAVVCVTEFSPRLEQHGETVDVLDAEKKITFAARAVPVLYRLLSGQPVGLAETTAATGVDAMILANVLVTEGICADLTPELLSGYTGLAMNGDFLKER
ncbi:MAG: JmjC domain-containing protein [Pseudonocardiaceae bacterium]